MFERVFFAHLKKWPNINEPHDLLLNILFSLCFSADGLQNATGSVQQLGEPWSQQRASGVALPQHLQQGRAKRGCGLGPQRGWKITKPWILVMGSFTVVKCCLAWWSQWWIIHHVPNSWLFVMDQTTQNPWVFWSTKISIRLQQLTSGLSLLPSWTVAEPTLKKVIVGLQAIAGGWSLIRMMEGWPSSMKFPCFNHGRYELTNCICIFLCPRTGGWSGRWWRLQDTLGRMPRVFETHSLQINLDPEFSDPRNTPYPRNCSLFQCSCEPLLRRFRLRTSMRLLKWGAARWLSYSTLPNTKVEGVCNLVWQDVGLLRLSNVEVNYTYQELHPIW